MILLDKWIGKIRNLNAKKSLVSTSSDFLIVLFYLSLNLKDHPSVGNTENKINSVAGFLSSTCCIKKIFKNTK